LIKKRKRGEERRERKERHNVFTLPTSNKRGTDKRSQEKDGWGKWYESGKITANSASG